MPQQVVKVTSTIDILILAHREALKNYMAAAFQKLGVNNKEAFSENEKKIIYHTGKIEALELAKGLKNG